jgi:hypothetical protein
MTMHSRPILLAATIIAMPLASALAQGYPVGNYAGNQLPPGSGAPTTASPEASPGNSANPTAAPTGNYAPRRAVVPGANGQIAGNQQTDQAKGDTVRNGSL